MMKLHYALRSLMLPLKEIDKATPTKGKIVELGCGEGVISNYLAAKKTRNVIGVDINEKRIPISSLSNLSFQKFDITKYKLKSANAVIISDVLHHLKYRDQRSLIKKIYSMLPKSGILIIKEIDTGEFIRSKLSRVWDFIFYPKERIYFNDSGEFNKFLTNIGFNVKIERLCRLFPGSTTLFICRK